LREQDRGKKILFFRSGRVDRPADAQHNHQASDPTVTAAPTGPRAPTRSLLHMTDAYKIALNEFKEASAAVRHAFAVQMEARAAQITANRDYIAATDAHTAASDRLAKADDALMMVKDQPETPPVSFLGGVTFVEATIPNGLAE
jgi:hypothetical protein